MNGRIQRLLNEESCEWCSAGLVMSRAKSPLIMVRTAKSSDGRSHAPIITLRTTTTNNSSLPTNVGAEMNDCLSLQGLSGRSLMTLMSEESLKSLGITDEDLSHDWMAVCREVSCDTEGFEYPSEDDEVDNYDDDDYFGDDGHYDEDNPNIPEATSSSLLAKYLWRKLKNANMAVSALTASLERVNITSSTDQKISAGDSARDTILSNNHNEAVDIDSVTLVRLVAATSNKSSTTNVPSDNTIPQLCSKREWFASSGKDASCNPAPRKLGRSSRENSLLSLDFLIRSDELGGVLDAVRTEDDDISISSIAIINEIIGNLDCEEIQDVNTNSLTTSKKKKKKSKRVIDFSTPMKPTKDDILFGRGGDINKHPGNVRFRAKALELAPSYEAYGDSKEEKYKVSVVLVDCMEAEKRRFLEKGPDGLWYKVLGNGIRKKASQALREKPRRHRVSTKCNT